MHCDFFSQTSTPGLILCDSRQKACVNYIKPAQKHAIAFVPNTFRAQQRFGHAFPQHAAMIRSPVLKLRTTAPASLLPAAGSCTPPFPSLPFPASPRLRKQNKHPVPALHVGTLQRMMGAGDVRSLGTVDRGAKSLLSSQERQCQQPK